MRPSRAWACSSACSWVSFSFLTRRPNCPCVTSRAFSRPWSTNFWSTSLSTTGMSAAAITCAISPPIVPAPTTAALNTNMDLSEVLSLREAGPPPAGAQGYRDLGLAALVLELPGEANERAAQRVSHRAADEEEVDQRAEHWHAALESVVEGQRHSHAVVELREGQGLSAGDARILDLGGLSLAGHLGAHAFDHP